MRFLCLALLAAAAPGAGAADPPSSAYWRDLAESAIPAGPGRRTVTPDRAGPWPSTRLACAPGWPPSPTRPAAGRLARSSCRGPTAASRASPCSSRHGHGARPCRRPHSRRSAPTGGQGLDRTGGQRAPSTSRRSGFHAQVLSPDGTAGIRRPLPARATPRHHLSLLPPATDAPGRAVGAATFDEDEDPVDGRGRARGGAPQAASGATLRTYRLASPPPASTRRCPRRPAPAGLPPWSPR